MIKAASIVRPLQVPLGDLKAVNCLRGETTNAITGFGMRIVAATIIFVRLDLINPPDEGVDER
jgi:hypothetical protein